MLIYVYQMCLADKPYGRFQPHRGYGIPSGLGYQARPMRSLDEVLCYKVRNHNS